MPFPLLVTDIEFADSKGAGEGYGFCPGAVYGTGNV